MLRVRIPTTLLERLRERSDQQLRGVSDAVRQALLAYLEE